MSQDIRSSSFQSGFVAPLVRSIGSEPLTDDFESNIDSDVNDPSERFTYKVVKRVFDIMLVLLISPFVLVAGFFIAILVFIDSPGPVLFAHSRIQRGGQYFSMWKFRTMCKNAPEFLEQHFVLHPEDRKEWALNHKLRNDPRVNAFGSLLRRTSLDELPQIWNVLTGDMSFVGPRPIVYEEIERYGSDYLYYAAVKPGITGLWQTSGRSSLTYAERVALDRSYVENWSFFFELQILLRTIKSIAQSEGAY